MVRLRRGAAPAASSPAAANAVTLGAARGAPATGGRAAVSAGCPPRQGLQAVPVLQELVALEAELQEPEDDGDGGDAQEDVEEAGERGPVQLLGRAGPVRVGAGVRAGPPALAPLVHQPSLLHLHDAASKRGRRGEEGDALN